MKVPPVVLSIAGYDPSSGAGITADVKTAAAHGCYAVTCITALTVQSSQGVFAVQPVDTELIARTLRALAADVEIAAVKVGMLGSREVAGVVADFLEAGRLPNIVLDPVLKSSSGKDLLDEAGLEILRGRLLSLADVITPNADEAAVLAGMSPILAENAWNDVLPQIRAIAKKLHDLGAKTIVSTGGHFSAANDHFSHREEGGTMREEVLSSPHIASRSTHGTGCAFATAVACQLANGLEQAAAVRAAKEYVRRSIETAYPVGRGTGPVNHLG